MDYIVHGVAKSQSRLKDSLSSLFVAIVRCYLFLSVQTTLPASSETFTQGKKQQFYMEQQTVSKLGKEYVKAVHCHSAYLTYMQSKSCAMLDWMTHKLESKLPGEISITRDMQMTFL